MPGEIIEKNSSHLNRIAVNKTTARSWTDFSLIFLLAVLAAFTFFSHLGVPSLFNPDEGLYAEPAREMLDTGEYITTLLNYVVRFTKPPLVIWAMALSYKIFGINEFAARFVCAASGFLLTLATYLFAWKYFGRSTAIFAACILITAPLFVGVGHMAITDMPLSLLMAGCLFSFFHAWQQKKRSWLWLGYVLVGLAVMTKGPVGLILPATILGIYFLLCAREKAVIRFLNLGLGSLIVAVIALPWFVIEIAITHGAYFREFILRENFARFTSVVDAHKGPWWYHIAAVFGGLFPWSIFLPQALVTTVKTFIDRNDANESNQPKKRDFQSLIAKTKQILMEDCLHLSLKNQAILFLFLWSVMTVLFFSVSVSKLLPYTLPAFPALAIIIAYQWQKLVQDHQSKGIVIYSAIIFSLFAGAALCIPMALKHLRGAPPDLTKLLTDSVMVISLFYLLALLLALGKRRSLASFVLLGSTVIFFFVMTPKILNIVSQSWEGPVVDYARYAHRAGKALVVYQLRKPAIPFYYGKRVIQMNKQEELQNLPQQCYLITGSKNLDLLKTNGCKVIAQDTHFALLQAFNPHIILPPVEDAKTDALIK